MIVAIPLRTGRGQNDREHWRARNRRVRCEKEAVGFVLGTKPRPLVPCTVTLTRIAPSNGLDSDNLQGSLKAPRDAVAAWLGVDDKRTDVVRYEYAQRRGPWAIEIDVH